MKYAYNVWTELRDRFSQQNAPRIYEIQHAIATHTQKNNSVAGYCTNLKSMWDELAVYNVYPNCSCGAIQDINAIQQRDHLIQFLMGLNDLYGNVHSQILLMHPLPSVNKAYSLVLQEKK